MTVVYIGIFLMTISKPDGVATWSELSACHILHQTDASRRWISRCLSWLRVIFGKSSTFSNVNAFLKWNFSTSSVFMVSPLRTNPPNHETLGVRCLVQLLPESTTSLPPGLTRAASALARLRG